MLFRSCRELEVNGVAPLSFYNDDFILKVSVLRLQENSKNDISNSEKLGEKLGEKRGELTKNRREILRLMAENPYITQSDLSKAVGVSLTAIENNIEFLRGKYIRRVGPDKGGFWEVIID